MPDFYVDNVEIEPSEYIDACTKSEIEELIECLVEDGHLPNDILSKMDDSKGASKLEIEFGDKLSKLSRKFYILQREDEEILEKIFKKYL